VSFRENQGGIAPATRPVNGPDQPPVDLPGEIVADGGADREGEQRNGSTGGGTPEMLRDGLPDFLRGRIQRPYQPRRGDAGRFASAGGASGACAPAGGASGGGLSGVGASGGDAVNGNTPSMERASTGRSAASTASGGGFRLLTTSLTAPRSLGLRRMPSGTRRAPFPGSSPEVGEVASARKRSGPRRDDEHLLYMPTPNRN